MVCSLVSIFFDSPQLGNENKLYKTLEYRSRDMLNSDFLVQCLRIVSPPHFVFDFSKNMFLMLYCYILINRPNIISWFPLLLEIAQYVYCNCLLTSLWRHKFWNQSSLSNQAVFLHDQKVTTKFKHLENKTSF